MNRGPLIRLIGASFLLLVVIAGYGFWYQLLSDTSATAVSLSEQIAVQRNATTKIDQAKEALSQLSLQEASINEYFVATSDVVPFLEQIQKIGEYLGAKVEVVSVSATPGKPYGQLTLSLTITGTFDAVARTIGSIEYGPYDTEINSLTLNANPVSGAAASSTSSWVASAVFTVGAQTGSAQASPITSSSTQIATSTPASSVSAASAAVKATSTKPIAE